MSHYTFVIPEDVYRWIVTEQLMPNRGQISEKGIVSLPQQCNLEFENGIFISKIIRLVSSKNGQIPSTHLEGIKNDNSKATKTTNWNFIWLCFDDLRMQFDPRIKDLILQGENALIAQIIKQLFDRDENKNQKEMKALLINQKPLQPVKSEGKAKTTQKNNTLDIKKINVQKNPDESESSLEFLILLLGSSFNMSVEQILGLFTNQNKYLAHLIVKGINDNFDGVILFYSLLQKHLKKLKYFCESDPRDAESCLYAIKPGMISKNQKVAELSIDIFNSMKNVYDWFISETGRGSTTLFLGIKRHPSLTSLYWDLLLKIIQDDYIQFFTTHFKKCFRDAQQMVQICNFLLPSVSNSFLKDKLIQIGILSEWIEIGINLFDSELLDHKLISFRFVGSLMSYMPEQIQQNDDYLINLRSGWKDRKFLQFVHLYDQILMILEELAGEKNTMARKVYQIIIEIMDSVYSNQDKRQYLVRNFVTVLPKFPKIPTQYLIEIYKQGTLKTSDLQLVNFAIGLSQDVGCLSRITQTLLKLFNSHAVLNHFLANIIYKVAKRVFGDDSGKILVMKIIKDCLAQYAQLEGSKKIPQLAKHQPMYMVQKGNDKYSKEQEEQFIITDKCGKNILTLVQKLTDLILSSKSDALQRAVKQQLMETNAIVKKNHYKTGAKGISNMLAKKFGISKEQEQQFNQQFRVKKSLVSMEESLARKKLANSSQIMPLSSSRYGGPEHLRKQFDDVTEKRKRQEQERRLQQQKKQKEQALKKILVKKELEKTNLLRGFGQEAELKEDGFWSKLLKDKQQNQLYPPELMEGRDIEYIDNLFKRYHKVLRTLFFKYTSSMYSTKSTNNFEDNRDRNQTLSVVELIQFLKDFKLFFLTSKEQIQSLVRDLNVKLLNKRETQDLDFYGFEQFIIQYCALIYTKTHTINATTNKGMEAIKKSFGHLSHLQLVEEWFNYMKLVFIQKGEKTSLFDEPEAAYFNETQVVKQFTRKLEEDPSFILPQGYKKMTEKVYKLVPKFSDKISKIKAHHKDIFQILDQILFQSELRIHLLEPLVAKQIKIRVKPHAFMNIKTKLLEAGETKVRALSSIIDKKPAIPPVKMLDKKTLTFGMKLGLSYVSYKDKLLGEQVAYIIDDMLTAVQNGRNNIDKEKIVNDFLKKKQQLSQKEKFAEIQRQKKRLERKNQLEKMKKDIAEKKQKQAEDTKQERERKKQKQLSRQKRMKEDKDKYLQEQKNKLKEKKKQEQQQQKKKKQEQLKKKDDKKKNKQHFQTFNQKQIQKFKQEFGTEAEKKKKQIDKQEDEKKKKLQLVKKLRSKIHDSDKKAIEMKLRINQEISELYNSSSIKGILKQYESCIRALFDFLLKSSYYSITEKKNNSEIIYQTWHYFSLVFQINPLIIKGKQLTKIFRYFTKDKQAHKDYEIGLTFDQFQQALLRVAIKHKSIFNKLAQKIKDDMTSGQIDAVVQKDIEQKQKNEFEEPKQIDVKNLINEEDIKKDVNDHYGDISKVNQKTLKGLIYYLKIPKDKVGQEKRFREVLASKISYSLSKIQQLREKLNDEYSLPVPAKKKKKTEANQSQMIKDSSFEMKPEQSS